MGATAVNTGWPTGTASWGDRIRSAAALLPRGTALDEHTWQVRHRAILILLWAHVLFIPVFGAVRGFSLLHVGAETALVATAALVAGAAKSRRLMAGAATLGILSSSAVLVHLSEGLIEMHFHFFVMVPVVALYQDWFPFLAAIGYVLLHHGLIGYLDPRSVFNHPAAWAHPWRWAGVHAFFIAGISAVCLITWRLNESALEQKEESSEEAKQTLGILSATLESTADGILVVDADGNMTHFNQRFVEMWQIPEEVVRTRSDRAAIEHVLGQLVEPDRFIEKVQDLYGSTESSYDELKFIDGRYFERFSQPLILSGRVAGRVWSFRDITHRKQAEESLLRSAARDRESAETLRALNEAKNLLLTAVSHELRTPLTSILGFSMLLEEKHAELEDEQRGEILNRLSTNAQRLETLVLDLFDLDRISRGIVEARRAPTDMSDLCRRVIHSMNVQDRTVTLEALPGQVEVDPGMAERVLENLVSNAVKHTPPGTPIDVRVDRVDEGTLLTVDDRGPGIADERKQTIFEAFTQGATPAHSPGTGIGLTLVSRFAEIHGGRAWVEDREGGGASFRVLFATA